MNQVLCLGCSGQTIWHETDGRYPSTLSLGMTEIMAERTGLTVIGDFRSRDVVLGGQGFPLTPVIDYLLFHCPGEDRVLIHLGGMATILSLPGEPGLRRLLGFQASPCNHLLDNLMLRLTNGRESCDVGGKHAVQGRCIEPLLQQWLAHPALLRRPPKFLPKHEFGDDFIAQALEQARQNQWSLHDVLCTATHFVARGILQALERFVPRRVARILLAGGGVRNGLLWHLLEQNSAKIPVERLDQHGIPCEAQGRRRLGPGRPHARQRRRQFAVGHGHRQFASARQHHARTARQLGPLPGVDVRPGHTAQPGRRVGQEGSDVEGRAVCFGRSNRNEE